MVQRALFHGEGADPKRPAVGQFDAPERPDALRIPLTMI